MLYVVFICFVDLKDYEESEWVVVCISVVLVMYIKKGNFDSYMVEFGKDWKN